MFHKKKPDPKAAAKDAKRAVRSGERDLDKEIRNLDRSEKSLVAEIKKTAKGGNQGATRTLAKQLVQLRAQKDQLYSARAKLAGVGNAATTAATSASLAGVMGNVAGVMKKVNEAVSTEETAKIMQQFAVENEKMNMSEEMMDDALIDAFDGEGVEEEADGVVGQVLAELGLEMDGKMVDAPTNTPAGVARPSEAEDAKLDAKTEELLAQLGAL
ncbi:similar to chromatin modifying protein 2B [Ectocarpus siliculosus]|uniref:Similar to chromatin modifying protein 2B n=1 Tax=Ectocarpus siliculosus TaxID=2880 RepID=D8LJ70_ECTSI|nr:similar to chromatin modifying protein 2B [Ectocarpus siliculosus]|eukprot:CBN76954.1 similar to chromatin modifying protein 2B [Ectocarpus siliculosus]